MNCTRKYTKISPHLTAQSLQSRIVFLILTGPSTEFSFKSKFTNVPSGLIAWQESHNSLIAIVRFERQIVL